MVATGTPRTSNIAAASLTRATSNPWIAAPAKRPEEALRLITTLIPAWKTTHKSISPVTNVRTSSETLSGAEWTTP